MGKQRARCPGTPGRRRQIIQAALACFTEAGFVGTTMEDIRARSGASNGSIYHHFKSKDQLAAAVYVEGISDYQDGMITELRKHPEAREGIYAIVSYHLKWVISHPEWAGYLFQMRHAGFMSGSKESMDLKNKNFAGEIWACFSRHIKEGTLRDLPMDLYISLILGPCQEYVRLWLSRPESTDPGTAAAEIAEAAWQALRQKGGTFGE